MKPYRLVSIALLLVLIVAACAPKAQNPADTNKEPAMRLVAAFNRHDAARLASLHTEDQVTVVPGEQGPVRGRKHEAEMLAG